MHPGQETLTASPGASAVRPTIKGIFVNSHVERVRLEKGEPGVDELERRFGRALSFPAWQDVPVRDEVRLIEDALDILTEGRVDAEQRAFEAGRLHFRNFSTTPWARVLFGLFPRNFRYMVLHAPTIAGRVFQGVRFTSEDLGPNAVKVIMENNDYPLDHFKGLFHEWMRFFGLDGNVIASETSPDRFEYVAEWD